MGVVVGVFVGDDVCVGVWVAVRVFVDVCVAVGVFVFVVVGVGVRVGFGVTSGRSVFPTKTMVLSEALSKIDLLSGALFTFLKTQSSDILSLPD